MNVERGQTVRVRGLRGHYIVTSIGKDEKWVNVYGPTEAARRGGRAGGRSLEPSRVYEAKP